MKAIESFELVDHGVEHEQYFQGCGVCLTEYEAVSTGTGDTLAVAIDDALEGLSQQDWETEGMERRILLQEWPLRESFPHKALDDSCSDGMYYYVSIRVK